MNDQDKILSFLRITGPVLPTQVAKHISSDILIASAHLSELSSQGKIKLSHLKIGGSPLYYLIEHKNKLQNFLHNLNPKDQQTLNSLRERKILQEKYLDLLTRVSLRKIRDFAVPLNVTIQNNKELFWKWFLLTNNEAIELIKSQLPPQPETKPEPKPEIKLPNESKEGLRESEIPLRPKLSSENEKLSNKSENGLENSQKPEERLTSKTPIEEKPKLLSENEKGLETREEQSFSVRSETKSPVSRKSKDFPGSQKSSISGTSKNSQRKPLFQKIKEKLKPKRKEVLDKFFPKIESFFQERNIKIESKETLRKNAEVNFILKIPCVVGKITYFCKAKNKKRCDERDLSAAYMEAQSKKLPLLFLYTNEVSKKAQEMLDSGSFENLIVKKA